MGTRVGTYVLREYLGKGASGLVYRAEGEKGELAAVKFLDVDLNDDPWAYTSARREVEQLRRVRGPGVSAFLESDLLAENPWIAVEFVDGTTLQQHVSREGPLRQWVLLRFAFRLAEALHHIHQSKVLHRDLKPANVMMSTEGPVLIDFGLSRVLESTAVKASGVVGTMNYMAPEQLQAGELTSRTDVFAFGAVLVFAATGREAFSRRSFEERLSVSSTRSPMTYGLSGPFLDLVLDCLSAAPEKRPSSSDLLRRLSEIPPASLPEVPAQADGTPAVPTTRALYPAPTRQGWTDPARDDCPEKPLACVLAATAVALTRTGFSSVPTDLLTEAHHVYRRSVGIPKQQDLTAELVWASRRSRTGGVLLQESADGWRPVQRLSALPKVPIPRDLWIFAAERIGSTEGPARVAVRALRSGDHEIAMEILERAAGRGDVLSRIRLAVELAKDGERQRAEPLLREVVELGGIPEVEFELGVLTHATGRYEEAHSWYRRAVERGHRRSLAYLNVLCEECPWVEDTEVADFWFSRALRQGEPLTMTVHAFRLDERWQPELREKWYRKALAEGGAEVLVEVGDMYRRVGSAQAGYFYQLSSSEGSWLGEQRFAEWNGDDDEDEDWDEEKELVHAGAAGPGEKRGLRLPAELFLPSDALVARIMHHAGHI